jgi:RNA polymerase sigma factor (sigma-70 family)
MLRLSTVPARLSDRNRDPHKETAETAEASLFSPLTVTTASADAVDGTGVPASRSSTCADRLKNASSSMLFSVVGPLEKLYRERASGFVRALAPVVGSREVAADVVQEAFAIALRRRRQLRRRDSLAPWVWQIALRLAFRERRRRNLDELPEDLSILDEHRDPALAAALRSLTPRRRLVVFLRYYGEFTYAEIADALGIGQGTVPQRSRRRTRRLRPGSE